MLRKYLITCFAVFISMPSVVSAQVPEAAGTFDTNVKIYNATSSMTSKIRAAEEHIKRIIASEVFRDAVLNHTYRGVKKFVDNEGLSNEQVYQKILEGAEYLNRDKNNTMDLEVEMYYERSSTVGFTYPNSRKIYANTKYYNDYSPASISGNLMHEWLHKLGFSHASSYSVSRDYSIPYAIGSILSDLARSSSSYITAPTGVQLKQSASNVELRWKASVAAAGVDEYKIYRKLDGSSTIYHQGTTTQLTFTQAKPTKGAVYFIRAFDRNAKSSQSLNVRYDEVHVLTPPSNLSLTSTSTSVTLKWSASSSSEGVKEYKIYRKFDGSSYIYLQGTTSALTFTQPLPAVGATYFVKVVDQDAKTVISDEVTLDFLLAPTNLILSKTTSSVTVKWSAGKASEGLQSYKIYRRLIGSSAVYLQGSTTSLSFTQSRPSTSAVYYVRIVDETGATAKSSEVTFTR
ncbi:MAG TPA: fibronectin type III domain-containing protein [Bacteriovoracaceae bacterium]|nr:fibronectin type III domain-containing protein [Bacteriovoracaceae bacterium]